MSDDNDNIYSIEEIRGFRDSLKKHRGYQHIEIIHKIFNPSNPTKSMTAEQAVYIGSAVDSTYEGTWYLCSLEHLANPHDLPPLLKELNALRHDHEHKNIQNKILLLSKMGVIESPPESKTEPNAVTKKVAEVTEVAKISWPGTDIVFNAFVLGVALGAAFAFLAMILFI